MKIHIRDMRRHAGATLGLYGTLCGIEVYGDNRIATDLKDATCVNCIRVATK